MILLTLLSFPLALLLIWSIESIARRRCNRIHLTPEQLQDIFRGGGST